MGREPKDYDVATAARPEQVEALFARSKQIGAHFGVVQVVGADGKATVEVATYRSEQAYLDGRRPSELRYETEPEADARRRDFTMNALFYDPSGDQLLDFTGGLADLREGTIRAIGEPRERFSEDHLRLLRAVRFAARFRFVIEPVTLAAIREMAPAIERVSAERNRDELTRILTEGGASLGLRLMDETGLLDHLLPEVKKLQGVEQPPEFHPEGDVWTHTLLMLELLPAPIPATLAWGVLLHDIGKPDTFTRTDRIRFHGHVERGLAIARPLLNRLKFSGDDTAQILALVQNHMRFMEATRMRESTLKRFLRLPRFEEHLELHRVDCSSSNGMLENHRFLAQRLAEMGEEEIRPPRLLTGRDLMEAGWTAGPEFSRILNQVEDAQLEGAVKTREEALELAKRLRANQPDGA
jgi:poly(A) polymerase